MQVFICYSRSDKQFAAQLVEDLSQYDLIVWMDVRSIPTGANWDAEVQKGLDSSDVMLVLLSPTAVASQNVADEWSYFIERNKPIVPLLVVLCEVPFRLSRRQRVDFTVDFKSGFEQLIRALGSPSLRDPDSTQKMRPVRPPSSLPEAHALGPSKTAPTAESSVPSSAATSIRSSGSEVGTNTYPIIWGSIYNPLNGLGDGAQHGDAMINSREVMLIPDASPLTSIRIKSIVSAAIQRSLDDYVKVTYYNADGSFQSVLMMGEPRGKRRQIAEEMLN